MKTVKWLDDHLEETLLVFLLVLISCVELIQVVCRNVPFIASLTWAEEFCRFCWIWSVFISLPYTIRKRSMLRVSVLLDIFPQTVRKIFNLVVDAITLACMAVLGVYSITVVGNIHAGGETSPAMLWPMWIVYSVMIFGFFVGALRAGQQVYLHIKEFNEKQLTSRELTEAEAKEEARAAIQAEGGKA